MAARTGSSGKARRARSGGRTTELGTQPRTNVRGKAKGATKATRSRPASGRYTPPIPRSVKRSPGWYPYVLLGILVIGIFLIILNYVNALPASPTNWYTLGGLAAILAAAFMATRYR